MKQKYPAKKTNNPCGSEPAREDGVSDTSVSTDTPSSRAGSLPQGYPGYFSKAVLNGNRTMFFAFSEPKYNHSPYSRTVVTGE